jgi:hypothetical protein
VVERVFDRVLDDAGRFHGREPVLGLTLELGLADENREHGTGADHHVVAGDAGRAFALADAFGVILEALRQRAAQARLVGAAVRRRDGVAIGREKAVGIDRPGDRPFGGAVAAGLAGAAGEDVRMHQRRAVDHAAEIVLEAIGEMEGRLFRHVLDAAQQLLGAGPSDLDAAEQIRLRARHLEHALGLEVRLGAENVRVRTEAHLGAAPIGSASDLFQLALGLAARERHPVERLLARDLDLHALRQRIGDRDADAVQPARGLIHLGIELAARVQRAHDHFERGFVLELGVGIDRDAAAVVGDGDETVGFHLDVDPVGMSGERLVHRIVDHLGEQVMERLLVGAADIHAGPPAHRLEPFQHLDMARGIAGLGAARGLGGARRLAGQTARRGFGQVKQRLALRRRGFLGGLGHASMSSGEETNQR